MEMPCETDGARVVEPKVERPHMQKNGETKDINIFF